MREGKRLKFELYDISDYKNEIYGISILWIMLFHAIAIAGLNYADHAAFLAPFNEAMSYGAMGCEIFLFCSGICLYFSFVKKRDILTFIKKRLRRLFLPVLIIDGWYWFLHFIILNHKPDVFFRKISLMDFWATGGSQIWFVSFILVCYFLYPYIFEFLFQKDGKQMIIRYILLMAVVVILTLTLAYSCPDVYEKIEIGITRFPIFITGCLFGKLVYEKRQMGGHLYLIMIGIAVITFAVLHINVLHGVWRRWWYFFGGLSMIFLITLVLKVIHCGVLNRIFRFFGKISLNLYLSHILLCMICTWLEPLNIHFLWQYFVLMGGSVLIAWEAELLISRIQKPVRGERSAYDSG